MTAGGAVLAWAALSALLAATVALAYVPMGVGNLAVSLLIATAKAAIIMLVFMKLWRSQPLVRLAAGTLVLWLSILIGLTFTDYLTRPTIEVLAETDLPTPQPSEEPGRH
ncbi:MAG TPA: cytochrome C oxidase subunit IV family protein [Pararhizobium sp.]|nr:cytochrome C oxidase subunit IV family protein [Paracoccaceae bacterium]HET7411013.1 cytochrome C oxidase subunit IV family protein [Pararhizobium sp.]